MLTETYKCSDREFYRNKSLEKNTEDINFKLWAERGVPEKQTKEWSEWKKMENVKSQKTREEYFSEWESSQIKIIKNKPKNVKALKMSIWYNDIEAIGDLSIVSFSWAVEAEPGFREVRIEWKVKV